MVLTGSVSEGETDLAGGGREVLVVDARRHLEECLVLERRRIEGGDVDVSVGAGVHGEPPSGATGTLLTPSVNWSPHHPAVHLVAVLQGSLYLSRPERKISVRITTHNTQSIINLPNA